MRISDWSSDVCSSDLAAFRATLEEVTSADLILHVRDMANTAHGAQKKQVLAVLADLGIVDLQTGESTIPILEVWNKIDLLAHEDALELGHVCRERDDAVAISAVTGARKSVVTGTSVSVRVDLGGGRFINK